MSLDDKLATHHLFVSFFLVGTSNCFGCQELTPLFEFGNEREMCSLTEPKGLQGIAEALSLCVHMMISELCSLLHIQSQAVRFDLLMTFMTILIFP